MQQSGSALSGERPGQVVQEPSAGELQFADVRLNVVRREASRAGAALELTHLEYELMVFFLRHPRAAFTRDQLCEHVWGHCFEGRSNHVDVAIMGLRRKLERGGESRLIQTLRGYGYVLRDSRGTGP